MFSLDVLRFFRLRFKTTVSTHRFDVSRETFIAFLVFRLQNQLYNASGYGLAQSTKQPCLTQ